MKTITTPYFHFGIKWATPVIVAASVYAWYVGYPYWILVSFLLCVVIFTSEYVTKIDLEKKECIDYLSIIWIPFDQEVLRFNSLDRIVIVKDNHSQVLNSRSRSRQMDWESFTGTLLTDEGKTLDLLTKNDKLDLLKGLKEFAKYLNVNVEDRTTNQYFIYDLSKIQK